MDQHRAGGSVSLLTSDMTVHAAYVTASHVLILLNGLYTTYSTSGCFSLCPFQTRERLACRTL